MESGGLPGAMGDAHTTPPTRREALHDIREAASLEPASDLVARRARVLERLTQLSEEGIFPG